MTAHYLVLLLVLCLQMLGGTTLRQPSRDLTYNCPGLYGFGIQSLAFTCMIDGAESVHPDCGPEMELEVMAPSDHAVADFFYWGDWVAIYKSDPIKDYNAFMKSCAVQVDKGELSTFEIGINMQSCRQEFMDELERMIEEEHHSVDSKAVKEEWYMCYWTYDRWWRDYKRGPCLCCQIDVESCKECLECMTTPPTTLHRERLKKCLTGEHSHESISFSRDACSHCGNFLKPSPQCAPYRTHTDADGTSVAAGAYLRGHGFLPLATAFRKANEELINIIKRSTSGNGLEQTTDAKMSSTLQKVGFSIEKKKDTTHPPAKVETAVARFQQISTAAGTDRDAVKSSSHLKISSRQTRQSRQDEEETARAGA